MNDDIAIGLAHLCRHICAFCGCLPSFSSQGEIFGHEHAYELSPVFFVKMPNLLTLGSFLPEASGVAFDDWSRSGIYTNDIFQHGPQNQHIPKP